VELFAQQQTASGLLASASQARVKTASEQFWGHKIAPLAAAVQGLPALDGVRKT